ncbi:hypothetical protein HGRIS_013931 [Hohenbuehelia grisea]|uniref:Uncharacterized protein n=1 Tax=Hohenbuehelia grisea TaxID=104357 RepID=A0ABR3JT84_9AGAR
MPRIGEIATYSLSDNIVGPAFMNAFNYEAIPDPTHGRVNYVDKATAQRLNLTYGSGETFILRADHTTMLSGAVQAGIVSGSFPARHTELTSPFLTFGICHNLVEHGPQSGRRKGEIDILEGVNDQGPNTATLHTSAGCTMPASRSQTGTALQNDCNVAVNSNAGCGVRMPTANSYGPSFNSNGGGWYAVERTTSFIKIWFWPRNSGSVPSDVRNGGSSVNTGNWGTPTAYFPNSQCDLNSHYQENNIIINLTFCGDWAGNAYGSSGYPSSCVDYVNKNPSAFAHAYFDFASLRVYT